MMRFGPMSIALLPATNQSTLPDASVTPDIAVASSYGAQAAGRDQELEAALTAMTQGQ